MQPNLEPEKPVELGDAELETVAGGKKIHLDVPSPNPSPRGSGSSGEIIGDAPYDPTTRSSKPKRWDMD